MARREMARREIPRKPTVASKWEQLIAAIAVYGDACRADEMKGGGDPESLPVIEAQLQLATARVNEIIAVLRREYE